MNLNMDSSGHAMIPLGRHDGSLRAQQASPYPDRITVTEPVRVSSPLNILRELPLRLVMQQSRSIGGA